jgi:hypothetical protein
MERDKFKKGKKERKIGAKAVCRGVKGTVGANNKDGKGIQEREGNEVIIRNVINFNWIFNWPNPSAALWPWDRLSF